eukprot:m.3666 g.3666  ORF g.3666 m.3666 type:complete len:299 (+) comp9676_c0_seq1:437-1333(+)
MAAAARKRKKNAKGTIKSHSDERTIASLLGFLVDEPKKTVEKQEDRTVEKKADISDDSLYESESDTFDSSEEVDSTLLTPRSASEMPPRRRETPHPSILRLEDESDGEKDEKKESESVIALPQIKSSPERQELRQYCEQLSNCLERGRGHRVKYKRKTLADYRRWKEEQQQQRKVGSLGFDRMNPEYIAKVQKRMRQKEYGACVRDLAERGVPARGSGQLPPLNGAASGRQTGINYARSWQQLNPVRKKRDVGRDGEPRMGKGMERQVPLLEIMKARHEKEKAMVQNIRKQIETLKWC